MLKYAPAVQAEFAVMQLQEVQAVNMSSIPTCPPPICHGSSINIAPSV